MLAVLVTIRDFLVAVALAWVGVSMEPRRGAENACAGEACDAQIER
jgi:hypothetical protein